MSQTSGIEDIPVKTIDGKPTTLGAWHGKVRLVVNVASQCGLTPQYAGLEALYRRFRDKGFEVLGFPANEFGAQEPGTEAEIQQFCSTSYGVSFPMFAKIVVKGDGQHPLYAALTAAQPRARALNGDGFKQKLAGYGIVPEKESDILWNFEKFLVDKDGAVVDRFAPDVVPDDKAVVEAIEARL